MSATTSSFISGYHDDEMTGTLDDTTNSGHVSYQGGGLKDDPNGVGDSSTLPPDESFPSLLVTSSPSRPSLSWKQLKHDLSRGFVSLQGSPPELYKAYVLKFLDSYSYFSFSIIFTLFLSNDFGFSDVTAGTLYGAWGALITIYGLLTGVVVDNLGVASSLKLGFALSLVARIGIFMTTSRTMLYVHICGTLPLANCLGIPVLTTGIRRYTNDSNRGFAFGLFYVVMNVAALISG